MQPWESVRDSPPVDLDAGLASSRLARLAGLAGLAVNTTWVGGIFSPGRGSVRQKRVQLSERGKYQAVTVKVQIKPRCPWRGRIDASGLTQSPLDGETEDTDIRR